MLDASWRSLTPQSRSSRDHTSLAVSSLRRRSCLACHATTACLSSACWRLPQATRLEALSAAVSRLSASASCQSRSIRSIWDCPTALLAWLSNHCADADLGVGAAVGMNFAGVQILSPLGDRDCAGDNSSESELEEPGSPRRYSCLASRRYSRLPSRGNSPSDQSRPVVGLAPARWYAPTVSVCSSRGSSPPP